MTTEFKLPLISEGVESADIAAVHVHEGDTIEAGQILLEVETEKAVAEIPSPQAGRIAKVLVKPGQKVNIGDPLVTFDDATPSGKAEPKAPSDAAKGKPPAAKGPEAKPSETKTPEGKGPEPRTPEPKKPVEKTAPSSPSPPLGEGSGVREPARTKTSEGGPVSAKPAATSPARATPDENGHEGRPVPAGPATRRLARELGVDLHRVPGTGPGGRITTEDVQEFVRSLTSGRILTVAPSAPEMTLPPFDRFGPIERRPMNKLARVSAANLAVAWQTVPHVTQHELADVTDLELARQGYVKTIGKNGPKVTMTAIMIKAVIGALKAYPNFNSSIDLGSGELILKHYYHIGVAVDTEYGLLVPVIRDADRKTVLTIATELGELAQKARDRRLELADMQGGTFTITNLGGIGGTAFTPIVNYPEAAILGMSRTQTQLKLVDGKLTERLMLPLSLSYDHRIVNGADAARFVVKLSAILSDCFQLLVEC